MVWQSASSRISSRLAGMIAHRVSGELTYGLERLAMYVLGVDHVMDMPFNDPETPIALTYGDVFKQTEEEYARWNFDTADTAVLLRHFEEAEAHCAAILSASCGGPQDWQAYHYGASGL